MTSGPIPLLTTALALAATIGTAAGGTTESPVVESPLAASPWAFEITPYAWLTGIDGSTGVGSLNANVDESFSDLLGNLKMAAALRLEARNNRWGIIADGMYAELGGSGNPPGPIYEHAGVDMQMFLAELTVAYRVYDAPTGFVDVYAGARYNGLSLDFDGRLELTGIQDTSDNASKRIVDGIGERADEIVQPKVAAFQAGSAARRAAIEAKVTAAIEAEADGRIKRDLVKQLLEIRRQGGLDARDIVSAKVSLAVKKQRLELAASTAKLEIAQLRASVDSSLQGKVTQAKSRVRQAEKQLATAINNQLVKRLPTSASANENWVDPIIGVRGQWNINEKYYFAGRTDIGGFSVGSKFAWSVLATAGYHFTEDVSYELGYRYLDTDYTNGKFTYDIALSGIYTSLNIRF